MVYLSYSFDSVAITVIHNGTLPMSDYVNIEIEPNRKIPSRIKNKLRNVTLCMPIDRRESEDYRRFLQH